VIGPSATPPRRPIRQQRLQPGPLRIGQIVTIKHQQGLPHPALLIHGTRSSGVSGLPETDVARVQRWCRARVPEHVRDQVRVEVDVAARHVTIVECRPPWRADTGAEWTRFPIARLRYTKATKSWSLYWRDRNLRFHEYDRVPASQSVEDLLAEVDRDPTAIFWG
jgi:hypothetical protein